MDQSLIGTGFYYDRGAMMEATLGAIRDLYSHQIPLHPPVWLGRPRPVPGRIRALWAYFEYRLSAWDFAAGMLIVQEAGGQVSNGRGQELKLCRSSIIASNTKLHPTMVEIVSRHHDRFSDTM